MQAAAEAQAAMAGSQAAVSQLAAMGYMSGGMDPTLQMLTSGDPERFLNQASTVQEIDNQAGMRLTTLQAEQLAAARAQVTAKQQIATVDALQSQINGKVSSIKAKLDDAVDSSAMARRWSRLPADRVLPERDAARGLQRGHHRAARRADQHRRLVRLGRGRAEPTFDCSGLVVWAFAQEGISLPHYTGSLWNSGMHVSRADLEPGDLVFFFADISHVGIYIGNGLMVDAPDPRPGRDGPADQRGPLRRRRAD